MWCHSVETKYCPSRLLQSQVVHHTIITLQTDNHTSGPKSTPDSKFFWVVSGSLQLFKDSRSAKCDYFAYFRIPWVRRLPRRWRNFVPKIAVYWNKKVPASNRRVYSVGNSQLASVVVWAELQLTVKFDWSQSSDFYFWSYEMDKFIRLDVYVLKSKLKLIWPLAFAFTLSQSHGCHACEIARILRQRTPSLALNVENSKNGHFIPLEINLK